MNADLAKNRRALGQRVATLRAGAGVSRIEFAERVGVAVTYIQELEAGRAAPSPKTVKAVADALAVPVEEIMAGIGRLCLRERPAGNRGRREDRALRGGV